MRKPAGLLLLGLGVFLLVLAPMLRFYAAPRLLVAPLDQYSQTVSEAQGATYLDVGTLSVQDDRTLVATRTVRGDVQAGTDDTAVWDVFLTIQDPDKDGDTPEQQLVSAITDRVAFDRRTSEAVACCGENVNGDPVEHAGIEYKFPFGAEQRTYQYFDTTLQEATPIQYVGVEEVNGLETYRYEQVIEATMVAEIDVPGALVDDDEATVSLGRYYSNMRTLWVEPTTGVVVKGQEEQLSTLRDETGEDRLVVTEATLVFTDKTVAEQVETASDTSSRAGLLTSTGPLVALLLGLVLAGAGLFLLLAAHRDAAHAQDETAEPAEHEDALR